ncbi:MULTISPECIES: L,D-transpeptidase [unclassified Rhodosalinus]|uniref:L,D-transpeptidase n=1 Tax=unclassified Rhodosalinus TaxID=2630183 RepID=UPI003526975E
MSAGRHARRVAAALALLAAPGWLAAAELSVLIDLSDQRMEVRRAGVGIADWPVSTARSGKVTPTGLFVPQTLVRDHRSTLYDGAPMPWSIFFSGNYAIHGTTQVGALGAPASAGCVRLHPDNARQLFELVKEVGKSETLIEIRP